MDDQRSLALHWYFLVDINYAHMYKSVSLRYALVCHIC